MLALVALVVVSHFSRLGDLPLLGEEGRRARSAINMIESDDWVVVTNQGLAFPDVRGTVKSTAWDMNTVQDRIAAGHRLKSLFASGGSVALKKTMFLKLGGFLPLYKPFYSEDMDLCTRAWMRGWQTLLENPGARSSMTMSARLSAIFMPKRSASYGSEIVITIRGCIVHDASCSCHTLPGQYYGCFCGCCAWM